MLIQTNKINFSIPDWLIDFASSYTPTVDLSERMRYVISASKQNVINNTGGPFAAAIFEVESGELVSIGVNLVTTERLSILHAEIVAIALAQRKLCTYDLGGKLMPRHELIASTEPCAMCFGAIPWSGVRHVVTAAQDKDARSIGFDEGPKPEDWIKELENRGIKVTPNIERDLARTVLQYYVECDGHIYNSRENSN